jgi:hypothetical protein
MRNGFCQFVQEAAASSQLQLNIAADEKPPPSHIVRGNITQRAVRRKEASARIQKILLLVSSSILF